MSIARLDVLNILLMLVSLGLALVFPFETFILAYAFIGPLHYFTEISWLHDRKNFCARKLDALFLIVPPIFIVFGSTLLPGPLQLPVFQQITPEILFFAFLMALVCHFTKVLWKRLFGFLGVVAATALFSFAGPTRYWVTLFLPTVVHVFIFTGVFILLGALRNRSWTGIASLGVFVLSAAVCFASPFGGLGIAPGAWTRQNFGYYAPIASGLAGFLGLQHPAKVAGPLAPFANVEEMYSARAALKVMTFFSFAYLYHYLNWFSKTNIIGWHRITKTRACAILGLWLASCALYLWNFKAGFLWLYLISLGHVTLEFPLNWLSMKETASRMGSMLRIPGMVRAPGSQT
jgi:hypothetical protein